VICPREALLSGRAGRTLFALAVGTAALPFGQLLLPPLLPAIVREFSVSPALAGVGLTLMWASAALAMFPGGRLSDVTDRVTALVAAVALATVGFLALALAPEFGPFVLAIVVCGVAVGIYEPSASALVSELFVSRRGQALGVINSSYNAGSALAGAAAAVTLAVGAWRLAFLPVVIALCIVGPLIHRVRTGPYRIRRPSLDLRSTGRRLLGTTRVRLLLGLFCLYTSSGRARSASSPSSCVRRWASRPRRRPSSTRASSSSACW
jgi:MFS family permease